MVNISLVLFSTLKTYKVLVMTTRKKENIISMCQYMFSDVTEVETRHNMGLEGTNNTINREYFVAGVTCRIIGLSVGFFIPSTQRYYRRLILLLDTTYTATCFACTTIFR
jgi:hypothetical protein